MPGDGAEAVRLAHDLKPDVVPDGHQHAGDGRDRGRPQHPEQLERGRRPDLTGPTPRGRRLRAAGGRGGYVTKDRIAAELIDAIVEISGR